MDAVRATIPIGTGECTEGPVRVANSDMTTISECCTSERDSSEPATSEHECVGNISDSRS